MSLLILYAILAVLVGVWAAHRGRSGIGYFALALIISPLIVFIILAVIGRNDKGVEQRKLEEGEFKKCPQCAELVRRDAKKCRYCSTEFQVPENKLPEYRDPPPVVIAIALIAAAVIAMCVIIANRGVTG